MSTIMRSELETSPFLKENCVEEASEQQQRPNIQDRWQNASTRTRFLLSFASLLAYTLLVAFTADIMRIPPAHLNNALSSPNVRYHINKTITASMSPFAGGPFEQVDNAWRELMSSISVRVSQEELDRNGNHQDSVSLPRNGGNLVWLNVFHQLHCLKMLRKMNYRDHYYPNQTEHNARDMEVHINHCIEQLRQAVMCNPDTSFTTFVWTHSDPKPVLDVRSFERQCLDWGYFMEGVKPRVMSYEEVDELTNPYLNKTAER
ncbi:hypothetical protein HBH98_085850 [Parastagonospora nodorum]|nr:hypothetical protein HBI10_112650 [Parastagonospora nodorum]KAH4014660.1 hypothetical protein HBI13_168980 [Parastagonospora nodorum]KAH4066016.1 hypothetical protein HBH50_153910 [Parastagonospora nodorum]KAH4087727.1 hypothetical protein HBH48_136480 [Parastagonospora nodorum]KAH4115921.1 hypothetical protein HBH47_174240 [Parastagonospora nodorum]